MSLSRPFLAIETSGRTGSIALLQAGQLLTEELLPADQRTARILIPAIHRLLANAEIVPANVGAVAVATGPGSFTGLRIGVTVAKTLSYAIGCQLVGVNTLDVLAYPLSKVYPNRRIWAVIDAQRSDLFTACYDSPSEFGTNDPTQLMSGDDWLMQLRGGDVVVGHAAARYAVRLPPDVIMADDAYGLPSAATVGIIGSQMLELDTTSDPFQLTPRYHRLSAAEEKRRS